LFVVMLSACRSAPKESKSEIIIHTEIVTSTKILNHEKPILDLRTPSIETLGCPPGDLSDFNLCTDGSPLQAIGCLGVYKPDSLLGGLQPNYPLLECILEGNKYLYQRGCSLTLNMGLVAYKMGGDFQLLDSISKLRNGDFQLLDSISKLRKMYAPIESEEEALSYALAGTGLSAYYDLNISKEYEYYVDKIEDTYVFKDGEDFLVHLYDYRRCGCGQHETYTVDVRVNHDGHIQKIREELVYRDIYHGCVD